MSIVLVLLIQVYRMSRGFAGLPAIQKGVLNMNESIRVLIVDDEERFRETTAAILERRGFEVKAVGSGSEAIEEIKNGKIDVVVLDLQMPDMDGIATLAEMNRLGLLAKTLILTGYGAIDTALKAIKLGAYDYLTKPCGIEELVEKIEEAWKNNGKSEK